MAEVPHGVSQVHTRSTEAQTGFRRLLEINRRLVIKTPEIKGSDNIPRESRFVVATSHLTDIDVQTIAAAMIRSGIRVGIASQATNRGDAITNAAMKVGGPNNFFDVSNRLNKPNPENPHAQRATYEINLDNFARMEKGVVEEDRTMVIAAHRPTHNWVLPERAGIGPVYAAHRFGEGKVLPVALDIHSATPVGDSSQLAKTLKDFALLKRPNATLKIAEPIQLSEIPKGDLENMEKVFKSETRKQMTKEEKERAQTTLSQLRREANQVMNAIALQLPPERRGRWPIDINAPEAA